MSGKECLDSFGSGNGFCKACGLVVIGLAVCGNQAVEGSGASGAEVGFDAGCLGQDASHLVDDADGVDASGGQSEAVDGDVFGEYFGEWFGGRGEGCVTFDVEVGAPDEVGECGPEYAGEESGYGSGYGSGKGVFPRKAHEAEVIAWWAVFIVFNLLFTAIGYGLMVGFYYLFFMKRRRR